MAPPLTEKQEKILKDIYYKDKNFFGRDKLYDILKDYHDISRRQVQEWLNKQEIHQLYAPKRKKRTVQNTILSEPYSQIGIDLMDMQNYGKEKQYVLTAIDLFSKKAWAVPLNNKEAKTVANGMKEILKQINHPVKSLRSDNGSEFISKEFSQLVNAHNIKQIFSLPHTPQSNGNIERFNGILKRLINMSLKVDKDFDWINGMDTLIDNYNNVKQATTGERPDEIETFKNYGQVKEHTEHMVIGHKQQETKKYAVGDKVRIKVDAESDTQKPNFSKEIYSVERASEPRSKVGTPYYYLKEVKGKFYNNDLLKVDEVEHEIENVEKWNISKIVDARIMNGQKCYEVQWVGYNQTTIEPRAELVKDVPKLVKQFEREHKITWKKTRAFVEPVSKKS
jgi:transposase InsO family protein